MIQCRVCGGQNEPGAKFCVSCGIALNAKISPTGVVNPSEGRPSTRSMPPRASGPKGTEPRMTLEPPEDELRKRGATQMPPPSGIGFDQTSPPGSPTRGAPPPSPSWDPTSLPSEAPRTLVGFLVSFEINPLGQYWPVHQGSNVVGRQGASPGLAIEIGHPTTSSKHAVLYAAASPSRVLFEDIGSTNGSFVNDHYVPPGVKKELHDGDTVRFGLFSGIVKLV